MIKTIEVAPDILAASLADFLSERLYIYNTKIEMMCDEPYSRHDLRELIKKFLTDDKSVS